METPPQETETGANLPEKEGRATYCPEDNKLRLYVGRVPRDEYLKLRAEGWQALHKQRETGGGDFAATWTPDRRDTALRYADMIEDEDAGPAERAADRAERFSGYRDKRADEAGTEADRYESGPSAHGYQSVARAERAAARHDRIAGRAVDAWSKAEYWQRRTAGVIAHALYKSTPGVRMGRIKTIETELRGIKARWANSSTISQRAQDWITHLECRLMYENQMLDAQGGRLEQCEVLPGGRLAGRLILKVSKSTATGRATSCAVLGPKVSGRAYLVTNIPHTEFAEYKMELERIAPGAYLPPTAESLAELAQFKADVKAATAKANEGKPAPPPLINPTDADAERLQAIWNARAIERRAEQVKRQGYDLGREYVPVNVVRITQAAYSANSAGTYSKAETIGIAANGNPFCEYRALYGDEYKEKMRLQGPVVCKLRVTWGNDSWGAPRAIIVLTDKPQKPLPAAVFAPFVPAPAETPAPAPATVQPDLVGV